MKLVLLALGLLVSVSAWSTNVEVTTGAHQIKANDYTSYNFGRVWVNSRRVATFNLRNTGTLPLVYKDANIYGGAFSANHNCVRGLMPNQVCNFEVAFWPAFEGMTSGRFVLNFFQDQVVVDLWGEATRM